MAGLVEYAVSPSVMRVWVSMPLSESTTRMPPVSNGYGPRYCSSHAIASGDVEGPSSHCGSDAGIQ